MTKASSTSATAADPGSGAPEAAALREELERLTQERDALQSALAELRDSEGAGAEWTQDLIERSHLGFFQLGEDGRFLRVNPALATTLGYESVHDLEGLPIDAVRSDPEHVARPDTPATGGTSVQESWRRRDGSEVVVRISYVREFNTVGAVAGREGIVEDVTEQHRQDLFVRRTERMASLGRMLAGVAHELNNPLTAICGFSQLMRKSALSEDDRAAVDTIEREGQRAARIVRELLSFARHDGAVRLERVDAAELVRYVARTQRYALETHGIQCNVEVPSTPLWVEADRGQLEQIVLNLLVNARQACEELLAERLPSAELPSMLGSTEAPAVTLAASRDDRSIILEVSDTGRGIPAEQLVQIWEPFWTTKPDGEGAGLGLAVVHAGVASLGGQIDVTSEEGRGSSFRLKLDALPIVEGMAICESVLSGAARALDVLLIGRSELAEGFVERLLQERGHAVVAAADQAAAERMLEINDFDVIVFNASTGAHSRVMGTLSALREAGAGRLTRLVVAGKRLDTSTLRELESTQLVTVLQHPADLDEFLHAVEGRDNFLRSLGQP